MSEDTEVLYAEPVDWMLCKADHDALTEVRDELWDWIRIASSGTTVMALGAGIAVIDGKLAEDEHSEASVVLTCSNREGFGSGLEVACEIGDEGIALSTLKYEPTGQGRSCDHYAETLAHLTWEGGFKISRIEKWLETARSVRMGRATISSEILGLPDY